MKSKLEYAFQLYDTDGNGYLDKNEIRQVIKGMMDLIGANKTMNSPDQVANECFRLLDESNDGKVSKGKEDKICFHSKSFNYRSVMVTVTGQIKRSTVFFQRD